MSTLASLSSSDTLNPTSLGNINDNFDTLNTDKAEKSGGTFTGDIIVPDEAYGAGWDNSLEVPTKNAVYDKIQSIPALTDGDKGDITISSSGTVFTIDSDVVTNAKLANMASATIKGRTSVGTGDAEDLTATQTTALLDLATTGVKGLMSPADKISMGLFPKICLVQSYADQTISPITNTYISFDTETTDNASFFPGTGTEITIPENGLYFIRGNIQFGLAGIGATFRVQIIVLSGGIAGGIAENTVTRYAAETEVGVTTNIYLTAGQVVKMAGYHTGGPSEYVKGGDGKVYLHLFKL